MFVYSVCDSTPGNGKRTQGHLDRFDGMGLFLHFCTGGQAFFRQQSVVKLASLYSQMRDMVASADMVGFKAIGANFPRRTCLLAGVAETDSSMMRIERATN